jgi:hypothetical protein
MSQENVELTRGALENFIAGKSEFDRDGRLIKLGGEEIWDPDIEFDVSESVVPDLRGVFHGKDAVRRCGTNGSPPGTPSSSTTSWLTPGNGWWC